MQDEGPLFCSSFCLSEPDYLFKNLPSFENYLFYFYKYCQKRKACAVTFVT
jgi:hypothetical protein